MPRLLRRARFDAREIDVVLSEGDERIDERACAMRGLEQQRAAMHIGIGARWQRCSTTGRNDEEARLIVIAILNVFGEQLQSVAFCSSARRDSRLAGIT